MLTPIAYGLAIAPGLLVQLIGGRFLIVLRHGGTRVTAAGIPRHHRRAGPAQRRAAVRQLTPRRATTT